MRPLDLQRLDCGGGLALVALQAAHLPLLETILNEPEVARWNGPIEDEMEGIAEHIAGDEVAPFLVTLDDVPIGYFQAYHANRDAFWRAFGVPKETWGLDMMLGTHRGQGLGRRMCRAMIDYLFTLPDVVRVQIDPDPENQRAVRCYAAAGFLPRIVAPGYDGASMVYMAIDRV